MSRNRMLRWLLGVEVAIAILAIAQSFVPLWQQRWIQDDAYISFRYAKHLVEGHGLVFNLGERVEGYTNFLWTVLSAFPLAIGAADPIVFMHGLGMLLWLATYAVLLRLGIRLFAEGVWMAPLVVLPLLGHYSYNLWFVSGMETGLVCFLTVAAIYFVSLDPQAHPRSLFWASLSAVALTMTRSDGAITLAALALAVAALHWRDLWRPQHWRRLWLPPLLPLLFLYVPFHVWRVWYYGSFYPNTYYAKAAYLTFYTRGWAYLSTYLDTYSLAWFLPLLFTGLIAARGVAQRFLWATVAATLAVGFYVVRLGGDFMEWRFLVPITGVVYPALIVATEATAARLWQHFKGFTATDLSLVSSGLCGAAALTALLSMTTGAVDRARNASIPGQETITLLGRYGDPRHFRWGEVGRLLDTVLPREITIATTSAGMIPFFCDRKCIDLHGLTDPTIAHEPVTRETRGRIGHDHWLIDVDAIRARGVQVLLPFAAPKPYALSWVTAPTAASELVSLRLNDGSYVEFEILDLSAGARAALRADPRLTFYGDAKTAPRQEMQTLRQRFGEFVIVDSLDVQDGDSHQAHGFAETWAPDGRQVPNFHAKMLPYAAPAEALTVFDEGRIIDFEARWQVHNVDPERSLFMVARNDCTGVGVYAIEVNGQAVPGELSFCHGADAWDERVIEVPAALLRAGDNDFRLRRVSPFSTELYYFWFLQARS